jgi:hypothetical protein
VSKIVFLLRGFIFAFVRRLWALAVLDYLDPNSGIEMIKKETPVPKKRLIYSWCVAVWRYQN